MKFAERLRAVRILRGLSQVGLADLAGIPKGSVGGYEAANIMPGIDKLSRLCDALDVSADYLLGRTDQMRYTPYETTLIAGLKVLIEAVKVGAVTETMLERYSGG